MEVDWWWWCGHRVNGLWFAQQSRMFRYLYFRWLCSFMPPYEARDVLSVNIETINTLNGETLWSVQLTVLRRTLNGGIANHGDIYPPYYITTYYLKKPPPVIEPDEEDADSGFSSMYASGKIYTYDMEVKARGNGELTIRSCGGSNDDWMAVGAPQGCWLFSLHRMRELTPDDLTQRTRDECIVIVHPGRPTVMRSYQFPQYILPTFGDHAPQLCWPEEKQERLMIEAYEYQERAKPVRISLNLDPGFNPRRADSFYHDIINTQVVTIEAYKEMAYKPIDPASEMSDWLSRRVRQDEEMRIVLATNSLKPNSSKSIEDLRAEDRERGIYVI